MQCTLQKLVNNCIIVIGIPTHTLHVLQPVEKSVLGPFKSLVQSLMHTATNLKSVINNFDVAAF